MLLRFSLCISHTNSFKFCRLYLYSLVIKNRCSFRSYSTNRELDAVIAYNESIQANNPSTLQLINENFKIYENFLTQDEEDSLMNEAENHLKRLKYQYDHWDDAIHGYREKEQQHWKEKNKAILQRVQDLAFPPDAEHLQHVHILDLDKSGYIKPHIDSVKFCGDTIAGLSLLSNCVMRLVHEADKQSWADILLRRRSLYVMRGIARYKYTHEILSEEHSIFHDKVIPRDRRISIICRSEPMTIEDGE